MNTPRTQIVATIGPASIVPDVLEAMIHAGLDVARLNLAWGDGTEHIAYMRGIRAAAEHQHVRIPIICDLAGPRVQAGSEHHFGGSASVLTKEDAANVALCAPESVEYFAQSYVGSADDVRTLRALIAQHGGTAKIIAKIERRDALNAFDSIVAAADAIMIARGDLGNEVPLEEIPFIEKDLIQRARAARKPVIVATEMMPSMIESDRPTRSDVTDVAYAVMNGADAVMLSNETTTGKHPREVVEMMERIIVETEKHTPPIERRPL